MQLLVLSFDDTHRLVLALVHPTRRIFLARLFQYLLPYAVSTILANPHVIHVGEGRAVPITHLQRLCSAQGISFFNGCAKYGQAKVNAKNDYTSTSGKQVFRRTILCLRTVGLFIGVMIGTSLPALTKSKVSCVTTTSNNPIGRIRGVGSTLVNVKTLNMVSGTFFFGSLPSRNSNAR